MLKETYSIYNVGSLSVHTLKSYPLKRSLAYINYYRLTKTGGQKVLDNTCVIGVASSLFLKSFLFPYNMWTSGSQRSLGKCAQKQTNY